MDLSFPTVQNNIFLPAGRQIFANALAENSTPDLGVRLSIKQMTNIRCDYDIIMIIIIMILMKVIENVHLMMIMMILTEMMMTLKTIFVPILVMTMLQVQ